MLALDGQNTKITLDRCQYEAQRTCFVKYPASATVPVMRADTTIQLEKLTMYLKNS